MGTDGAAAVGLIVGFGRALRAAGIDAGAEQVARFGLALDQLDLAERAQVYWAGRATLCTRPGDLRAYDVVFDRFFGGVSGRVTGPRARLTVVRPVAGPDRPDPRPGDEDGDRRPGARTATASDLEVLRHRDLARLSSADAATVRRLIGLLAPTPPMRRSRRHRRADRGELDPRRTVRASVRRGGEPTLRYRRRAVRPRRLVLVIDVSGSMSPYADALLRFGHAAVRARPGTEVFTVGTRLTRISRQLAGPDPGAALAAVSAAVPDWSGGTRLGELLRVFLDAWGQPGLARGAVVVVASDGWERGDATLLGAQMARLARLAHRVVWVNPHRGKPGYAPVVAGMAAALPYVDDFVAGHSLAAYEELAAVLSAGRAGAVRPR